MSHGSELREDAPRPGGCSGPAEELPGDSRFPHDRRLFHVHGTLAHFPVALVATSLAFYVAGIVGYKEELGPSSRMCLLAALCTVPFTAASGFVSWRRSRGANPSGIFLAKIVGSALLAVAGLAALLPELARKAGRPSYGIGLVICLWVVSLLAHLGGIVVHRRIGLRR